MPESPINHGLQPSLRSLVDIFLVCLSQFHIEFHYPHSYTVYKHSIDVFYILYTYDFGVPV